MNVCAYNDFEIINCVWHSYDHTDISVDINGLSSCPICKSKLLIDGDPWWVLYCENDKCGWWANFPPPQPSGFHSIKSTYKWSLIKKYNIDDKNIPIAHLSNYLRNQPEKIPDVHTIAFEKLIQDFIKDVYRPIELIHIGQPHDGGKDLYGILSNDEPFFVEVKRRKNNKKVESIDTVRKLIGVMVHDGVKKGIVVSSAKGFSPKAKELALPKSNSLTNYALDLISFDEIAKWLKIRKNEDNKYYRKIIKPKYLEEGIKVYIGS